jgi:O-antigen/teichoic acid export membrane protein
LSGRVVRTAAIVALGQLLATGLGLAAVVILARRVEAGELGTYLYLVAVAAAIEGVSDAGLRFRGVALLSSSGGALSAHAFMSLLWRLKLVLSALAVVVITAAAGLGLLAIPDPSMALLAALVCVTLPSSNPLVWQLRAAGLQWIESGGLVLYRLLLVAVALLPEAEAVDARLLFTGLFACNVVFIMAMLAGRGVVSNGGRLAPAPMPPPWITLLRESTPLGMSLLLAQLAPRLWVIWLGLIASKAVVAEFSLALTVVQTVLITGVILSAVFLPLLSRVAMQDEPEGAPRLALALVEAGLLLGTLAGMLMALAAWSISAVVFGDKFAGTGGFLWLMAGAAPLALASFVARFVLSARAGGQADLGAAAIGLACGVAVAAIFAPKFGATGLALAYVAAEGCTAVLKMRIVFREFNLSWASLAVVTKCAPLAFAAALLGGQAIARNMDAGPAALMAIALGVCLLAALIAVGPGGGRRILKSLVRS